MRKLTAILFAALIAFPSYAISIHANPRPNSVQEPENQTKRKLKVPSGRRRRTGRDRRKHRGIGHAYKSAGKSAGRGGKRFGKNIARGKPIKGGKELGKGMGGFGKHTGKGTARVAKKVGRKIKHAVTP